MVVIEILALYTFMIVVSVYWIFKDNYIRPK